MKRSRMVLVSLAAISILTFSSIGINAEWKSDSNGWWYSEDNSYVTGWKQIDSVWYYFDNDGYMKKGWLNDSGKWYFFDSNGSMQTGIIQVDGKTYYFAGGGEMHIGDASIDGESYYFENTGAAVGDRIPQASKAFTSEGIIATPNQVSVSHQSDVKTAQINLPGNPATGYRWEYQADVNGIIKEDSSGYKKNFGNEGAVGVSGTYTWNFSALKEGTTKLTFKYCRPGEKETKIQSYIFTVDKNLNISVIEK